MRVVCACLLVFLLIGKSFSSENTWNFQAPFQKPLWSLGTVSAEKKEEAQPKTVLYLNGNTKNSVWFYLGAFYALESYGVKIDSVVGQSYGIWLASLWKSGWALDDIQRLVKGSTIYENLLTEKSKKNSFKHFQLPVAKNSPAASLQMRLALDLDSSEVHFKTLPLETDSAQLSENRFRLRVEESLSRTPFPKEISVMDCMGNLHHNMEAVVQSMPFSNHLTGAGCELALPSGEDSSEFSIILSSLPKRFSGENESKNFKDYYYEDRELSFWKNSFLMIRPHLTPGNSPESWMQSGFSAVEQKLSEFSANLKLKPYETYSDSILPWFRLTPVVDSVPSELQAHLLSFFNEEDSGFAVVDTFMQEISESPVYDSLTLHVLENGTIQINATSPPVLDLTFGGFGSSAFGAFLFGDFRVRYVNQFEYELGSSVFYGMGGFGVSPEFRFLRLLDGKLDFGIRYDYRKIKPLKSFSQEISQEYRIEEERRSDISFQLDYHLDKIRTIGLRALVAKREFRLDSLVFPKKVSVKPLSPELTFEQKIPGENHWFARNGLFLKAALGLESDGAVFGEGETVPIFWKLKAGASFAYSPVSFVTLGFSAFARGNIYQEDGKTYPPSFGLEAIDNTIRSEIIATPFSNTWYLREFRSHHYISAGARLGFRLGNFSAWLFGSYVHDFEEDKFSRLENSRLVLEPLLRYSYKSIEVSAGMTRMVNLDSANDLTEFSDYRYFVQVGKFVF